MSILFALACATEAPTPDTQPDVAVTPDAASEFDVTVHDADAMQAGTTVLGLSYPQYNQRILELDRDGDIVWEYVLPDEIVAGVQGSTPALTDVSVLEHDRILFSVHGKGVYEIDRAGELLWSHLDDQASHDVDRLDNGNTVYTRTWAGQGDAQVVEVNRLGEVVWSWSGGIEYQGNRYRDVSDEGGAWMHINAMERRADGSTAMCIRNFNAVSVIDASGELIEETSLYSGGSALFRSRGEIRGRRPHACEWQSDGVVVFATRSPERLIEVDTATQEVLWSWSHESVDTIRDADRLGNGNTLVVSSDRLLEITPAGDIVWELVPPAHPDGITQAHLLHAASRIGLDGQVHDID
ncbi:MAG: PQQ-binding-like beta-propeller repeat protein [Proteobacteria bacterium]|nr:PQQ-binding-like beta-propeller repeat protein [Pseudomonadota bacterium]MCP4918922.1 PQQ-binding-like beta-propeller repeat protein [Pseudomonadota bacterium]